MFSRYSFSKLRNSWQFMTFYSLSRFEHILSRTSKFSHAKHVIITFSLARFVYQLSWTGKGNNKPLSYHCRESHNTSKKHSDKLILFLKQLSKVLPLRFFYNIIVWKIFKLKGKWGLVFCTCLFWTYTFPNEQVLTNHIISDLPVLNINFPKR